MTDPNAILARSIQDAADYLSEHYKLVFTKSIESAVKSYRATIGDLTQELLRGGKRLSKASFRAQFKRAIADDAPKVFKEGWEEGEGDPADIGPDDSAIVLEFIDSQQGFVNDFSDWLTNKESDLDQVPDRLDTWAASMKNLGDIGKARAMGDPPLTFKSEGGATENGCDECDEYEGQTHKLSWWESRGLTKRNGNDNFGCGRWKNCPHHLYHAKTGDMVIE